MPTKEAIDRLRKQLRLETPLIAVYDAAPGEAFKPMVEAKGRACCFAYYTQWLDGQTVVFRKGGGGCPGGHRAFGLEKEYPEYMAGFLTTGEGVPPGSEMTGGEGLKATAELAQEFLDNAAPPEVSGDTVLIGPLRLDQWDDVMTVTFLVDPDRLAGVMTLAGFWSGRDVVRAPFSSGCGMMWRSVIEETWDPAVIGCTDLAMRRYVPAEILSLTVSPERFEQMLTFPDNAFLFKDWWNGLMESRGL
ncbi:MAG: DUF169 domain-containing protein [Verrucomicrobia bacterium]|nr:DUF169 domain-containing protein [Verrucomicrobiota bacterium]